MSTKFTCKIFGGVSEEYRKKIPDYVKRMPVYFYEDTSQLLLTRNGKLLSTCTPVTGANLNDKNGESLECKLTPQSLYDCYTPGDKGQIKLNNCRPMATDPGAVEILPEVEFVKLRWWCTSENPGWSCAPVDVESGKLDDVLLLFDKCQEKDQRDQDEFQFDCQNANQECRFIVPQPDEPTTPTNSQSSPPTPTSSTQSSNSPPPHSSSVIPSGVLAGSVDNLSSKSNPGVIAAGVLGGLFFIALIVLGIILLRWRKDKEKLKYMQNPNPNPNHGGNQHPSSSAPPVAGAYSSYQPGSTGKYTDVTVTGMHDTPTIPGASTGGAIMLNTMTVNAIDDKYASRTFDLITQEIKDFIGNYFDPRHLPSTATTVSTIGSPSFPKEIRDIWNKISSGMLPSGEDGLFPSTSASASAATAINPRVRMLVLRATVWALIQDAWRSGELIGRPGINSDSQNSGLRQEAFSRQVSQPGYGDHQAAVTQSLTRRIDGILPALVNYTSPSSHTQDNPSRTSNADRHAALAAIIDRAASLCGELRVQAANFMLEGGTSGGTGGNVWDGAVMEDIDGLVVGVGVPQNTKVRIVVAPGLVKWGDSRGMNKQQRLVLVKEKVLLEGPGIALDGARR